MTPFTRRDFLRGSAVAILGSSVGFGRDGAAAPQPAAKSRVVLVRREEVLDENSGLRADVLQEMLDQAVARLTDTADGVAAFKALVKPGETVGIKTNFWSYLPTPKELEQAIKRRVMDAGVDEAKIGIDDYEVRTNPLFVNATSIINVRPIRTHYLAGMSGCLKNYIMFAESQPFYHPDSCADLGALWKLPNVVGRNRLNVLCCLTPQFHTRASHHFSRRYTWNYKGLLVGKDPVAVDSVGLRLICAKRREVFGPEQELPPVPKHIALADTRHGIGTSDPARIELIKLGWDKDIMI